MGMGCRKQRCKRPTFGNTHDGSACNVAASIYGTDVIHPLVEVG
jgi:hypothetical protein